MLRYNIFAIYSCLNYYTTSLNNITRKENLGVKNTFQYIQISLYKITVKILRHIKYLYGNSGNGCNQNPIKFK